MDQDIALGMLRAAHQIAATPELAAQLASLSREVLAMTGAEDGYVVLLNSDSPASSVWSCRTGSRIGNTRVQAAIRAACERTQAQGGPVLLTENDADFDAFSLKAKVILWAPFMPGARFEGGVVLANPERPGSGERLPLFGAFIQLAGATLQTSKALTALAARNSYLEDFDDLVTKLPNRVFFKRRLEEAIRQASAQRPLALLFVDLDDFEAVNRQAGHHTGDLFLAETGRRLQWSASTVQPDAFVGRLGGDEFGVLLSNVQSEAASRVAARLVEDFRRPMVVGSSALSITASVGFTLGSDAAQTVEQLLWQADQAMYAAKSAGKRTYRQHQSSGPGESQPGIRSEESTKTEQSNG